MRQENHDNEDSDLKDNSLVANNKTKAANNGDNNSNVIQKGDGLQVIIGLGASGLAAANYLSNKGYRVAVTDSSEAPSLATKLSDKVEIRAFGAIDSDLLNHAARIIISPGVPLTTPALQEARKRGISIVSDIQIFVDESLKANDGKGIDIVAITGSNAKSTVTTLVGQMAKDAGVKVGVGGNIGLPALSLLSGADAVEGMQLAVLELSSFQLETVSGLGAKVATVLNMSPDHLDRHGDMLGYHQAKHRIFQGAKNVVISRDDALTRPLVADDLPRLSFGTNAPDKNEYGLITDDDNGQVYLARGATRLIGADDLHIKGTHNLTNALAALAIGELAGLPIDGMLNTLKSFTGLEHRCQFVATVAGIDYFNDSKGTNIGSTKAAITGLGTVYAKSANNTVVAPSKLLLIIGGQGKGQNFGELAPLINRHVCQVLLIGEDRDSIAQQLKEGGLDANVEMHDCATLERAVLKTQELIAHSFTQVAAVLLSPACASFDQFSGFAERGERFCELVNDLQKD